MLNINDDGTMTCSGTCPITGDDYETKPFPQIEYRAWVAGVVAQLAFPSLSLADREFLITGITSAGWKTFEDHDGPEAA